MAFKIGFAAEFLENKRMESKSAVPEPAAAPRRSMVQVYFAERNMNLAYYNDQFDLHCGDTVYVDGKLEGMRGRVTQVSYNFKIKVSDYKRVIAVADTAVNGRFFMAGSHFVTFDRAALPGSKVVTWYKAPAKEDDAFVSGSDDTAFCLDDLWGMNVSAGIAERGHNYYTENRVRYISLDGSKGYAIVEGSTAYEVEFEYRDGTISGLICSCFCSCSCKHEFAAMLQLKEALGRIEKTTQTNMRAPATLLWWTRARCSPSPSPARKPEASRYKRAIRFAFTPLNTPPGCFGPAKLSLRLPSGPGARRKRL